MAHDKELLVEGRGCSCPYMITGLLLSIFLIGIFIIINGLKSKKLKKIYLTNNEVILYDTSIFSTQAKETRIPLEEFDYIRASRSSPFIFEDMVCGSGEIQVRRKGKVTDKTLYEIGGIKNPFRLAKLINEKLNVIKSEQELQG